MEIGTEISQKIRAAIKSKLQELGSYVDDELPDYIMVMLANKRNEGQMVEDLTLFLGDNTSKFTDWLYKLLMKLQQVTNLQIQDNEVATQKEPYPTETAHLQTTEVTNLSQQQTKEVRSRSPVKVTPKARKRSPVRGTAQDAESKTAGRTAGRKRSSEKLERSKITSCVVKTGSSSRGSSRKRRADSDDEDADSKKASVPSVVKVREKRPTLALSKQATSSLLKKAVTEAHMSVSQLVDSSSYDPTSPPLPIRTHSYAEKQQQKELLLQQHRELQQELVRQHKNIQEEEKKKEEGQEEGQDHHNKTPSKTEMANSNAQEATEEPLIELRVSEAEALEYSTEEKGDTRIVAFADSQAGGDDSEDEKRRRRRKRRAVKSKDRASSPKFIVTLDGVGSDLEDKYDVTEREERHKRLKKEVDDFEVVDTKETVQKAAVAAPEVDQVQFILDTTSEPEEELNQSTSLCQPQERCKFWPDCKNGDKCSFYHPTVPCRTFPKCRFGEKCLFIHPVCKFNGGCTNPLCGFLHKSKGKGPISHGSTSLSGSPRPFIDLRSSPPVSTQPVPCRFYPNCTKPNCQFYHPSRKPCRFGAACTKEGCLFSHPPKPSELKWVKPPSHVSDRNFAVPLESVTPMPVK